MFNKAASSLANTAQKHALKRVNKLGLEEKAIGVLGTAASGYTAGVVNKDDIGRIANLAKNPNKEGLMNAVKGNATVSKAFNNPLFKKAVAAHELAQNTLNNPAVAAAVSHASSAVASTTAANVAAHPAVKAATNVVAHPSVKAATNVAAHPNTGGKYKKKRKSRKRKSRKGKSGKRKSKKRII